MPDGAEVTVLFSGGVDSTLVACAAGRYTAPRLITVGVSGSGDLRDAESTAGMLALPWSGTTVDLAEVQGVLRRTGLTGEAEPRRSVLVALALALDVPSPGPRLVGQGADELFGGYAHFRGLNEPEAERRRTSDWRKLVEVDWPATIDLARAAGVRLVAPFLDAAVSELALAQRLPFIDGSEPTKPLLRAWAKHRGIPESVADRPKRAIQYGSGIAALVRAATRA
ncbi:MAG: asparagine synthase-related protein [Thermoplasmata archaeon]|nr:asparagine synthase-related protein [Thermoplasmata archaeon]